MGQFSEELNFLLRPIVFCKLLSVGDGTSNMSADQFSYAHVIFAKSVGLKCLKAHHCHHFPFGNEGNYHERLETRPVGGNDCRVLRQISFIARHDELCGFGAGCETTGRFCKREAVKGGEKVCHCGGGIVYHRHDEKGLNWEPGGIRSGAGVRSSGVSQESTGSSDTWEAALCRLCLRR